MGSSTAKEKIVILQALPVSASVVEYVRTAASALFPSAVTASWIREKCAMTATR
jgi:hypothetical protein